MFVPHKLLRLALLANSRLAWKIFPGTNILAYFVLSSATKTKSFKRLTPDKTFLTSSLMTRPNKLGGLALETLSSQVLEFEGKARANPIGVPFRLGNLMVLPANVRLFW